MNTNPTDDAVRTRARARRLALNVYRDAPSVGVPLMVAAGPVIGYLFAMGVGVLQPQFFLTPPASLLGWVVWLAAWLAPLAALVVAVLGIMQRRRDLRDLAALPPHLSEPAIAAARRMSPRDHGW